MSEDAAVLAPGSGQLLDYAGACTRVQCMCSACATQAGPAPPRPAPPTTPYAPLPRFTRRAADLLRRVLRHVLELAAPPRRARPLRQRGRRRVRAPRRRAVERRAVREPHDRLVLLHPRVGLRPAQGVAAARVDARLRVQELAPDGDLVTCFPCAEGACCGCLRRRRHSLWPPFSASGAGLRSTTCHSAKSLHSGSATAGPCTAARARTSRCCPTSRAPSS